MEAFRGEVFCETLRKRAAGVAVNGSSARNMGKAGPIPTAREFLVEHLDREFLTCVEPAHYGKALDRLTRALQSRIRRFTRDRGDGWGPSRKFINLFMRDMFYDHYLRRAYVLARLESVLELPLDSFTARHLIEKSQGALLRRAWPGVSALDAGTSRVFQAAAQIVASHLKTRPVHLDILFWRRDLSHDIQDF